MKKLFGVLLMVIFVLGLAGVVGAEGLKKMCVDTKPTQLCINVPEKAPDFFTFPASIAGSKKYSNGNGIQILAHQNDANTVLVGTLVAKRGQQVIIIAFKVFYSETNLEECYEDITFTRTGKSSGVFTRVKAVTDFKKFEHFIAGTEV